ncbi:MAG: hypothetical protein WAV86_10755 [Lutibacter sp.]
MKNTSLKREDTSLISVLQDHFKEELNLARVKLIGLFITALCKVKTINYDRLASGFDVKANKSSSFNIEDAHVTDLERLEKLFSLTMIAFVWCYKIGDCLDKNIKKNNNKKIWQKSNKRV